jgi:hypothetical protein
LLTWFECGRWEVSSGTRCERFSSQQNWIWAELLKGIGEFGVFRRFLSPGSEKQWYISDFWCSSVKFCLFRVGI